MDLTPFALTLRKELGPAASQFLSVHVPFNDTYGFMHVDHARILLDGNTLSSIAHFRDNQLIIAPHADPHGDAHEVTQAIRHLSDIFIHAGIYKPSGELSRVTASWDDLPLNQLAARVPLCDSRFLRFAGLPIISSALAKVCPRTHAIELARRAEGKAAGQYDLLAMGKHEAHRTGLENMIKEIQEETGRNPILDPAHPDCLTYIETVWTIAIHDNCVFQRGIQTYIGGLDGLPQPTPEVSAYATFTADAVLNPPEGVTMQRHVAPVLGCAIAYRLGNESYLQRAAEPVHVNTSDARALHHASLLPRTGLSKYLPDIIKVKPSP